MITGPLFFQYSTNKDQEFIDSEVDGGLEEAIADAENEAVDDDDDDEDDENGTDACAERLSPETLASNICSPLRSPITFSPKVPDASTPYQVRI
jgi:hypothetical protein